MWEEKGKFYKILFYTQPWVFFRKLISQLFENQKKQCLVNSLSYPNLLTEKWEGTDTMKHNCRVYKKMEKEVPRKKRGIEKGESR